MTIHHLPDSRSRRPTVIVFVAACTGTMQLSNAIGLPVTFVGVTQDPETAVRHLNETRYGSGVRWPGSFQPIDIEDGWTDWKAFHMDPAAHLEDTHPRGAHFADGHVVVPLPVGTTVAEFSEQLSAAMRHMRLQEVVIAPAFLEARSADLADYVVHPRYTPDRTADGFRFRNSRLCTNLFVFDPAADCWRLLWVVVAALLAATDGRPSWK